MYLFLSLFSSCSPDFGVGGVLDRLGQISPKLVFFSLGYLYGGRWYDSRGLAKDVLARLPGTRTKCDITMSGRLRQPSCALENITGRNSDTQAHPDFRFFERT